MVLLAVAMQGTLVLAHAHVHSHQSAKLVAHGLSKSTAYACRAMVPPAGCGPAIPSDRHDDCPLCWSLTASGAGVLPTPLTVAISFATFRLPPPLPATPLLADAGASQFQARAPPAA
jgi:hypothetical protein